MYYEKRDKSQHFTSMIILWEAETVIKLGFTKRVRFETSLKLYEWLLKLILKKNTDGENLFELLLVKKYLLFVGACGHVISRSIGYNEQATM